MSEKRLCEKCHSWQLPNNAHFNIYTPPDVEKPKPPMQIEMCIHCPVCNRMYKVPFEVKDNGTATPLATT